MSPTNLLAGNVIYDVRQHARHGSLRARTPAHGLLRSASPELLVQRRHVPDHKQQQRHARKQRHARTQQRHAHDVQLRGQPRPGRIIAPPNCNAMLYSNVFRFCVFHTGETEGKSSHAPSRLRDVGVADSARFAGEHVYPRVLPDEPEGYRRPRVSAARDEDGVWWVAKVTGRRVGVHGFALNEQHSERKQRGHGVGWLLINQMYTMVAREGRERCRSVFLSGYRCVAAGVKPKTTARERCDGARVRPNPSYPSLGHRCMGETKMTVLY